MLCIQCQLYYPVFSDSTYQTMSSTITDFITLDLMSRIQSGQAPPAKLALTHLAEHYRVSITPVRLAVNVLLKNGYLIKQKNGRLRINPAKVSSSKPSTPSASLSPELSSQDWETQLIEEILTLSLRGKAVYLREEAVAKRYEVGRTIVRQVFTRLAGKGLLRHIPRCGWCVCTFDERDMCDYLVAREALELTALELAQPHLVPADLETMLQGNLPGRLQRSARLDNRLHQYLIEKSGNAYIRDFFDRHGLYYTFLFDFAAPEAHVMDEMAVQHRAILSALLAQDWVQARIALSHHIRSQRPVVKQLMEALSGKDDAHSTFS
jgi:DNA-binding GntR family transcriptional regulator